MNLLEHYIIEVLNITVLQTPEYTKEPFVEIKVLCDCWGDKRVYTHVTTRENWEQDLKRGYFMA